MAKFNATKSPTPKIVTASTVAKQSRMTTNLAGGDGHVETPELELASIVLTSMVTDQYYRSEADGVAQLKAVLDKVDPLFAAQAAVYARNVFGMRSVSHIVAGEIAPKIAGQEWAKDFYFNVVRRPDDMTEIASYVKSKGLKFTNAMTKGFGRKLSSLDAYSLAKYRGEGKGLKLVDLVNLCHPKSTDPLSQLVRGTLSSPDTWEVAISAAGQAKEPGAKAEAWTRLVRENKLPHLALLRNLRNIQDNAPEALDAALARLTDPETIKNSLTFPFQYFVAAYQFTNRPGSTKIVTALSKCADIALGNIPVLEGNTLVVLDTSGSMGDVNDFSSDRGKKTASPLAIGSVFAAAMARANGADFISFGTTAAYKTIPTDSSLMTAVKSLKFNEGWGTDFHSIFKCMGKRKYDRIMIFSDMQGWVEHGYGSSSPMKNSFRDYKTLSGADPILYSFDLAGYGTLMLPERKIVALAGYSDRVFDIMGLVEKGEGNLSVLIDTIKGVTF